PKVLLMDEPCSALDPSSTRRIEETIREIVQEVTIVIVTHNMQQAARISDQCAFFLAEAGSPGVIVEHGDTATVFDHPDHHPSAPPTTSTAGSAALRGSAASACRPVAPTLATATGSTSRLRPGCRPRCRVAGCGRRAADPGCRARGQPGRLVGRSFFGRPLTT